MENAISKCSDERVQLHSFDKAYNPSNTHREMSAMAQWYMQSAWLEIESLWVRALPEALHRVLEQDILCLVLVQPRNTVSTDFLSSFVDCKGRFRLPPIRREEGTYMKVPTKHYAASPT